MNARSSTARALSRRRRQSGGHTLVEITISMGITALLATGFFHVFSGLSAEVQQEVIVSNYQDGVRLTLYQMARDLRLAGANPTGEPELFDGIPATDVAVDLDPDLDGDITNGILVRADKSGAADNEADGYLNDTLEAVMFHWDKPNARIMRHVWRIDPSQSGNEIHEHEADKGTYDATPFQEGICTFKMTYYDRLDAVTTVPDDVASIVVDLTTASGPGECHAADSFTRSSYAIIRVRNR